MSNLCEHDWVGDDECAYCRIAELEAEVEQLRYERAQAGKRAMSAETEVERLREAHQKNVDQYRHNGSIWPSICAARMCDNSLKALEDE